MSANKIPPARGMRDFPGDAKRRRSLAIAKIASVFRAHGFSEIETPAIEPIERLTSGQGGDNEKMLFRILRRGLSDEQVADKKLDELCDLGLRFDLTVPLARFYATHQAELPRIVRCIQIGPVWRAERPQKGRFRQFTQCDIDILGEAGVIAEIELIVATVAALDALGIDKLTLRINDRRLLTYLLESCGIAADDHAATLIAVDKLDKIGLDGVRKELEKSLASDAANSVIRLLEEPAEMQQRLQDDDASEWMTNLQQIREAVISQHPSLAIQIDATLVRGMGYYTGPIFEIERAGSRGSIAGGGRYDEMIGRFMKRSVPACGFSIGFERIVDELQLEEDTARPAAVLVYDGSRPLEGVMRAKLSLVERGFDVQLLARSKRLGKELAQLESEGAQVFKLQDDGSVG